MGGYTLVSMQHNNMFIVDAIEGVPLITAEPVDLYEVDRIARQARNLRRFRALEATSAARAAAVASRVDLYLARGGEVSILPPKA